MVISLVVLVLLGVGLNLWLVYQPTKWPSEWVRNADFTAGPNPYDGLWPERFVDNQLPEVCRCTYTHEWSGVVDYFDRIIDVPDEPELGYESQSWTQHQLTYVKAGMPFIVRSAWHQSEATIGGPLIEETKESRFHVTGLILNPLVYAVPVWFALILPVLIQLGIRRIVSRSRRHRGLCQHCGYDTQGLAKCPECGDESSVDATIQA